jgi:phosphotriesterase-related protein
VVIGHCGDTDDIDYLRRVADRGSVLGMDRFGLEARLPYDQRIKTVARLCELGYAPQMVLATDSSAYSMNFPDNARQERLPRWRAPEVMNAVVPDLRKRGVSDDDIHTMMTANPVRILDTAQRSKE